MATKIYGTSDDLIEFDGDVYGEVTRFGTDEQRRGVLVILSDGTLLEVKYGKNGDALWEVKLIKPGSLFSHIEPCFEETYAGYSDIAYFKDGLKWAYAAMEWEKVK